jgi:AcrR family transcriptional regulator
MIVAAVLPLVIEHGAAVTTSRIARAAGIGEGTIFRAFKDKDELLDECVAAALRPDGALSAIAEIPLDQSLDKRLAEAVDALSAHFRRMVAVMGALHGSGKPNRRRPDGEERAAAVDGRNESLRAMTEAITELIEPDAARLRLPLDRTVSLFLSLLFTRGRGLPDQPSTAEMVDLFLHGAVEEVG